MKQSKDYLSSTMKREVDFNFYHGMNAYEGNNYPKAIRYFQQVLEVEPTHCNANLYLASAFSKVGRISESSGVLYSMLWEKDLVHEECYYLLGRNCLYEDKGLEAKKYIDKYLNISVDKRYVDQALKIIKALHIEETTSVEKDEEIPLLLDQAAYFTKIHKDELAIQIYLQIIKERKDCPVAYNNVSLVYFQNGQVKEALAMINEGLGYHPFNVYALCNKGMYLMTSGDAEAIATHCQLLKTICPINHLDRMKLGATLAMMKEFEAGYGHFYSLQKAGYQGDFTYFYWYSFCAYMIGQQDQAHKLWQRIATHVQERNLYKPWQEISEWLFFQPRVSDQELEQFLKETFQTTRHESKKVEAYFYYTKLTNHQQVSWIEMEVIENENVRRFLQFLSVGKEQSGMGEVLLVAEIMLAHIHEEDVLVKHCIAAWFYFFSQAGASLTSNQLIHETGAGVEYFVRKLYDAPASIEEILAKYNVKQKAFEEALSFVEEILCQAK